MKQDDAVRDQWLWLAFSTDARRANRGKQPDFVAVAETLLGAPYLWGGKTFARHRLFRTGADRAAGGRIPCPRDSDMQEPALGNASSLDNYGAAI